MPPVEQLTIRIDVQLVGTFQRLWQRQKRKQRLERRRPRLRQSRLPMEKLVLLLLGGTRRRRLVSLSFKALLRL
jgi:hypothetical protein